MLKKGLAILACVSVLSLSGAALGQLAPEPAYPPQFMDFPKGSEISGKLLRPKFTLIRPDPKVVKPNLIDYRYDFVPETLAATDDV